ncbi:hypothetical protein D9756_003430 [Leucocoprinus leucothites]|uniref:G domain-containing protein n=1 Tax=Leucocoprinus leucothites TaxID=201217 RepID=A0A8H5G6F4_9AGAR|nr:hypothetical protein D9756_003430 [Leucoagaricus leucothites]
MQPIGQDTSSQPNDHGSSAVSDRLTVPTLAASPSHSSERTVSSYYSVQSSPSPYLESPPSSPDNVGFGNLIEGDLVIAVMGPTGAGKSKLIKVVTGSDDVRVGNGLSSCTQGSQVVQCRHPTRNFDVHFVDTPGFDDTSRSDIEILQGIADWLEKTYQKGIQVSGILYLHRITDNRMPNSLLRNLDLLQKLCGRDALPNVRLVTTGWDLLQDTAEGERKERDLSTNYWNALLESGSQMHRFENTPASAWEIINSLPMERRTMLIQKELVDQRKPLGRTSAGKSLFSWATKALRELIARLESLVRSFVSSTSSHENPQPHEASQRRLREVQDELRRIESLQSLPSHLSGSLGRSRSRTSIRSSDEPSTSYDSDSSHSSWRFGFHHRLDERGKVLRRQTNHLKNARQTQHAAMNPDLVPKFDSIYLGPTVLQSSASDISEIGSSEDAIGAPAATRKLTGTIQALRAARAAVTGLPAPGLAAAVGTALRVAELLDDMHDTDRSLTILIHNVSRFIKTICDQERPAQTYPKAVTDAIQEFSVQLQKIEGIARRLGKKKMWRRCILEPEDRRVILDCNDAIKLALHSLGIRVGLTTAAQNEDILHRLNDLQNLVTRMLNNCEDKRRKSV